jgi:hypothetical protein
MWLSYVLGALGVAGQYVMVRNRLAGWWISLAAQPLWLAFALVTEQYGLLPLTVGYTFGAVLNIRQAHRDRAATVAVAQPVGPG